MLMMRFLAFRFLNISAIWICSFAQFAYLIIITSMKALNRHYDKIHKNKAHPVSKCRKAKCTICHHAKVLGIPNRQQLRQKTMKDYDGL